MRNDSAARSAPLWPIAATVFTLLMLAVGSLVLGAVTAQSVATHWPPILTLAAY